MTKNILVTNDDGVLAPGLLALTHEMRKLGKVTILAPDRNWSGGGHVKTLDRALRARRIPADGAAFAGDGPHLIVLLSPRLVTLKSRSIWSSPASTRAQTLGMMSLILER
jgi:5'/3'-nucleotidase SurE